MEYIFDILLYLAVFVISSGLIYIGLKINRKKLRGMLAILVGILMPSIMAGIRYGVGVDFFAYLGMFNNVVDGRPMYFRFIEPASSLIIYVAAFLRSSFIMFFSFSLITNICFFLAFKRIFEGNSKPLALAFLLCSLILFSTTLNAIRSGVALSLITLAFSFIISEHSKKSLAKTLFFIVLAAMFHWSALLALLFIPPLWFFKKQSGDKILVKKVILWFIYLLTTVFAPLIYAMSKNLLPVGDYARYLTAFGQYFSIPLVNILMYFPIALSFVYLGRDTNLNQKYKSLLYCAAFYIPLSILTGWLTYVDGLSRLSFMLEPIIICLMALLLMIAKKLGKVNKIVIVICIVIVSGLMFVRNLNWSKALPYETIFQQEVSYATGN